jgi:L-alanine-DL-glutamate epimerase-like enolase superfamily enzyme
MTKRSIYVEHRRLELRSRFRSDHSDLTSVESVAVAVGKDGAVGRGECRPFHAYGQTVDATLAAIRSVTPAIERGVQRDELQTLLPAGSARNAIDCALWDLEAKFTRTPVWKLAGLPAPRPVTRSVTLSAPEVDDVRVQAQVHADWPVVRIKVWGDDDLARVAAVAEHAPRARIMLDANGAWDRAHYEAMVPRLAPFNIAMIEQPFAADRNDILDAVPRPIPVCADESRRDRASLEGLSGRYDSVNTKLEKAGGLTEALTVLAQARSYGLGVGIGCMTSSSLAVAPAVLLAVEADFADLDSPRSLVRDIEPAITYNRGEVAPPAPTLWG